MLRKGKNLIVGLIICILFAGNIFADDIDKEIERLLNLMTVEEKIQQLYGESFMQTPGNERLGIKEIIMDDGPHGIRNVDDPPDIEERGICFPVGISLTSTWDTELTYLVGKAMGQEFWAYGKDQQLGPCIDLCRDPINGRSPETGGEDPYLSGKMNAAIARGIQEWPVIATVKHFNLVNRQNNRNNSNIIISERNLMESYGRNFKIVTQEGNAWSLMNSYNLINGIQAAEHYELLTTILRDRWGYPFYVVSDWQAVHKSDKSQTKNALLAGTDICMDWEQPAAYNMYLRELYNNNEISDDDLDRAVKNVLRVKLLSGIMDPNKPVGNSSDANTQENIELCLETGRKSIVLLKNENNILPLNKNAINNYILLIGPSHDVCRIDGFGSSEVSPPDGALISPLQAFESRIESAKIRNTKGCNINDTFLDVSAVQSLAPDADYVIFIGGLDETQEGEGYDIGGDRKSGSVMLPGRQQDLINEIAKYNNNIIVVLESGGICSVTDNTHNNIKGFIYAFYPGQEGGNAIADVILGDYNPGGKLPVTMPIDDSQIIPNDTDSANFDENYIGYKYYDDKNYIPRYAFGHGLSYSSFSYGNLSISPLSTTAGEPITVSFDLTNTGGRIGDEVVQLYLSDNQSSVAFPEKELKKFKRISLAPSQTQTVTFTLTAEDFYFWNQTSHGYQIDPGQFTVKIGGASDNLQLEGSFTLISGTDKPDFEITSLMTYPRYPQEGDFVSFYASVKNKGTSAASPKKISYLVNDVEVVFSSNIIETIRPGGMALIKSSSGFWKADSGNHIIKAVIDPDNTVNEHIETNNDYSKNLNISDLTDQSAYTVNSIPGTIEAENYDNGGNNAAYYDSDSANNGGEYRTSDAVDIETCTAGGYNIGWINAKEWLEYTVNVAANGYYNIEFYVAGIVNQYWDSDNRSVHIEFDGKDLTGSVVFNAAESSTTQDWKIVTKNGIQLTAGQHIMRICFDTGGFNFDKIVFISDVNTYSLTIQEEGITISQNSYQEGETINISNSNPDFVSWTGDIQYVADPGSASTTVTMPAQDITVNADINTASNIEIPGTVQAEDYHEFSDTTTGNTGGEYRDDDVDIEICNAGGYNVGWIAEGEILKYNLDIKNSSNYTINFFVASLSNGGSFSVEIGTFTDTINFDKTDGWQNWIEIPLTNITLNEGTAQMTLTMNGEGFNLDKIVFIQDVNTYSLTIQEEGITVSQNSYQEGETINISNSNPDFISWTGDIQYVADPGSASTTVTMPAQDITVNADINSGQYIEITVPFEKNGSGEFWYKTTQTPEYINSWNLDLLEINGVNLTNIWKSSSDLPEKQDGYYYIHYNSSVNWGHFEIK